MITESQLRLLVCEADEVVFGEFFDAIKELFESIRKNPLNPQLPSLFSENRIEKSELIDILLENGILSKDESFDEPNKADGGKTSVHKLKYHINTGSDIKQKLREKVYDKFFKNGYRIF